ncbi:MAG: molybdopterin biosynthesis protein, partial [Alphaproteobacteria bacterium]
MTLVLAICAVVWGLGWAFSAPIWQRWVVIGGVWALAFVYFGVVSDLTSDNARVWGLVTFGAVVVLGYGRLLAALKRRRRSGPPMQTPADKPLFEKEELDRYARHILLREIGGPGQKALKQARV